MKRRLQLERPMSSALKRAVCVCVCQWVSEWVSEWVCVCGREREREREREKCVYVCVCVSEWEYVCVHTMYVTVAVQLHVYMCHLQTVHLECVHTHLQVMHCRAAINIGTLLNGNCLKCEDISFDRDRKQLWLHSTWKSIMFIQPQT